MLIISLFLVASTTILLLCIILLDKNRIENVTTKPDDSDLPFVSVLIAVRNESQNIEKLCASLDQLNYPKSAFEILIGNDHSTDDSLAVLQMFVPENSRIIDADQNESNRFGKLEMLRKLTNEAKGGYFLFTDADVVVNPDWIRGMISSQNNEPRLSLGITSIHGKHWFHQLQNIDWLFNQKLISWTSRHLGPITAWGNNMCIKKATFDKIGGYNGIEKSIVEDVDLMHKVVDYGGTVSVNTKIDTMVKTNPCINLKELIHQRVRWFPGIKRVKWFVKTGMLVKMAFLPLVIMLGVIEPWFLLLIPLKVLLTYLNTRKVMIDIKQNMKWYSYLFFDFYEFAVNFLTFVMYILPIRVNWKGRKY